MTNKEAITVLWEEVEGIPSDCFDEGTERFKEAVELAIKALEERDDLIERAYGHVVGQGTKGVIRPDDLQGWRYEE